MNNETIEDRLPPCSRQQPADRRNSPPPPRLRHNSHYSDNQFYQPEYDDSVPQEMTFCQRLIATVVIIAFTLFAKWVYMRMGK